MKSLLNSLILLIPVLAACTSDPYQRVYENINRRNEALKTPSERASSPHIPSYKEYKRERERLNKPKDEPAPGNGDPQLFFESR